MTRRSIVAGAVVGATLAAGVVGSLWLLRPHGSPLTSSELLHMGVASQLMGRVSGSFVGARRLGDSIEFFDRPVAGGGDSTCRVRTYRFSGVVGQGEPESRPNEDKLVVEDRYAILGPPEDPPPNVADQEARCSRYRDFDNLVWGEDGLALDRVVNVLTRAVCDAKEGHAKYQVTCEDSRDPFHPIACDGLEILRTTDVRRISWVHPVSGGRSGFDDNESNKRSETYIDDVDFRPLHAASHCGQRETLDYEMTTEQMFGKYPDTDGELRALKIWRSIIC